MRSGKLHFYQHGLTADGMSVATFGLRIAFFTLPWSASKARKSHSSLMHVAMQTDGRAGGLGGGGGG